MPKCRLWSGKRDSNPRPRAWKARALPTELFPLSPQCDPFWWRGEDSNLRRLRRQIYSLLPLTTREPLRKSTKAIIRPSRWPELNWQPTDYKSVALPLSYIGQGLKSNFYAALGDVS